MASINIKRALEKLIVKELKPNRVLLLLGARRVGKTYLINNIIKRYKKTSILLNGEDMDIHQLLANRSAAHYRNVIGRKKLLVIDEAQSVPNIGKVLKLMVDELKGLKIMVTGSSAFDLLNLSGEPLTGRLRTLYLYPVAQMELTAQQDLLVTKQQLEERLVFGSYPEIFRLDDLEEKMWYLIELMRAYLLRDILAIEGVRMTFRMLDLLRLLAYQVGNEVSYEELGKQLGMSKNTVFKYMDLLSKVFIIFKLEGYSKNLRKEISKSSKWYFYDNGIRNALINNFNLLALRDDVGNLWENYLISERLKRNHYKQILSRYYFWRTYDLQEIDIIEESSGQLNAWEIKWGAKRARVPIAFGKAYPKTPFGVINRENYLNWIG